MATTPMATSAPSSNSSPTGGKAITECGMRSVECGIGPRKGRPFAQPRIIPHFALRIPRSNGETMRWGLLPAPRLLGADEELTISDDAVVFPAGVVALGRGGAG